MKEDSVNQRKERLRQDLRDPDYREQYATSALIGNVSAQVQALRRQRGLSQEELAKRVGTKQPRISSVENPPDGDKLPNWEVDTLDRIAKGLGTRLKISFETFGSLVEELDAVTTESLRRPEPANDPILFPKPPMPEPDPTAPERTRWMQELMIPWLWEDKLEIDRLLGWLQGSGLPPVGAEEEPYQWLLRGVSVPGPAQDTLEKRLAERLAIILGEQPDVDAPVSGSQHDFLNNLYWTCAGLRQPAFLGEPLWQIYRRVKYTKPPGAIRDALQGALVQNQFGETKPLKEIWEPMIERGRHRWLRGREIVGYEGILVRHLTVKPDLDKVLWALGRISQRWETTGGADRLPEFERLIWKIPGLDQYEVARRLVESARDWAPWARPMVERHRAADGSLDICVRFGGTEYRGDWNPGGLATTSIRRSGSDQVDEQRSGLSGQPRMNLLVNELLTRAGNEQAREARVIHAEVLAYAASSRGAA
ncbi:MAG TPA: helix-turn-helix domain-containing protein [Bryobacteraceae bacterium]|nr:helix-turn-helix domain-containing protein [Bryobacteraceae bacterium]